MLFFTKKELARLLAGVFGVCLITTVTVVILMDKGIIKLPTPEFKLFKEEAEEPPRLDNLTASVKNESTLIAETITPGVKVEVRTNYTLKDGSSFHTTTLVFTPGLNDAPSDYEGIEHKVRHSMLGLEKVKDQQKAGQDPEVTAVILTWTETDGNKYSLLDVNGDGQWDYTTDEVVMFADSDDENAKQVYADDAGNILFAKCESLTELYSSDPITFADVERIS